eukprot:9469290-Pyramimonas_sp.AAC.1
MACRAEACWARTGGAAREPKLPDLHRQTCPTTHSRVGPAVASPCRRVASQAAAERSRAAAAVSDHTLE